MWRQDAIRNLDSRYADTLRTVQIAAASLTFDDLVPLEHMLREKRRRVSAAVRAERRHEGPSVGSTAATGVGLGAVVTYQGKTLVRLGGEKFYISGAPPRGSWVPKGAVAELVRMDVGIPVQVTVEPFVPHRVRVHGFWTA